MFDLNTIQNNIRKLQSRTDRRGAVLHDLENQRSTFKEIKRAAKLLLGSQYAHEAFGEPIAILGKEIQSIAEDQKLDRLLLKQQYAVLRTHISPRAVVVMI